MYVAQTQSQFAGLGPRSGSKKQTVNPIAFISSFYSEASFGDYHDSPLWRLRRTVHKLNDDDEFSAFRSENPNREIAWVAEWAESDLGVGLKAVDRLVEVLAQSELYICILADARHGAKEHGSPIPVGDLVSATSYLEIELYAAVMQQKEPHLFIQEGFSPGPRLEYLLKILSFAFPNWKLQKPKPPETIVGEVRQLILNHIRQPKIVSAPFRQLLVRELYIERAKKAPPGHEMDNVLFLDGQFEKRTLPQKDLVEQLLADYERVPEMQRKLSRMWIAARELMSASYLPEDVQTDSRLKDFLPLWEKVLSYWTGAASWSGWHGHIYAGTVAPLNSQAVIRSQLRAANPPNDGLASAYYSVARFMPSGFQRLECLRRSFRYIQEAIRANGTPTANQLAIRGSIWLQFGNGYSAVKDFKKMLKILEQDDATEEELADAMVHLGFGYLFCGRWFKGRDYLERGVRALNPNHAGIARAKRKLAIAYKLTGKRADYKKYKQEADADAVRLGALDQINR
jgi:tetratricopeptide (TPR) repeat protein